MNYQCLIVPFLFSALIGCSQEASESATDSTTPQTAEQHSGIAHESAADSAKAMSMNTGMSGTGDAFGTVRAVDPEAGNITISHGPFTGDIQMDGMTMGFDTLGGVSLAGINVGDDVAFRVKRGRDGNYRIVTICAAAEGDLSCLAGQ